MLLFHYPSNWFINYQNVFSEVEEELQLLQQNYDNGFRCIGRRGLSVVGLVDTVDKIW